MGRNGVPVRSTATVLVALAGLVFTACGGDQAEVKRLQDQVSELRGQVTTLKDRKSDLMAHLNRAIASRKDAYFQLSWARTNVDLLRDKVAGLEESLAAQESASEDYVYEESEPYSSGYEYPYSDPYEETYGSDLDCDDYAYDNFDPGPGDPYGLDADGDGIACES